MQKTTQKITHEILTTHRTKKVIHTYTTGTESDILKAVVNTPTDPYTGTWRTAIGTQGNIEFSDDCRLNLYGSINYLHNNKLITLVPNSRSTLVMVYLVN